MASVKKENTKKRNKKKRNTKKGERRNPDIPVIEQTEFDKERERENERVISEVQTAWKEVAKGSASESVTSCCDSCEECRGISLIFKGKSSAEVSPGELIYERAALSLLTPKAFHYFLPAWLLLCLRFPSEECVGDVLESLLFHFEPSPSDRDYARARFQLLTLPQRQALATFFLACKDDPDGLGADEASCEQIDEIVAWLRSDSDLFSPQ